MRWIAPLSSRSSESSRGEKPCPQNNVKNMKVCIRLRSSSEKEWLVNSLKNEWNKRTWGGDPSQGSLPFGEELLESLLSLEFTET